MTHFFYSVVFLFLLISFSSCSSDENTANKEEPKLDTIEDFRVLSDIPGEVVLRWSKISLKLENFKRYVIRTKIKGEDDEYNESYIEKIDDPVQRQKALPTGKDLVFEIFVEGKLDGKDAKSDPATIEIKLANPSVTGVSRYDTPFLLGLTVDASALLNIGYLPKTAEILVPGFDKKEITFTRGYQQVFQIDLKDKSENEKQMALNGMAITVTVKGVSIENPSGSAIELASVKKSLTFNSNDNVFIVSPNDFKVGLPLIPIASFNPESNTDYFIYYYGITPKLIKAKDNSALELQTAASSSNAEATATSTGVKIYRNHFTKVANQKGLYTWSIYQSNDASSATRLKLRLDSSSNMYTVGDFAASTASTTMGYHDFFISFGSANNGHIVPTLWLSEANYNSKTKPLYTENMIKFSEVVAVFFPLDLQIVPYIGVDYTIRSTSRNVGSSVLQGRPSVSVAFSTVINNCGDVSLAQSIGRSRTITTTSTISGQDTFSAVGTSSVSNGVATSATVGYSGAFASASVTVSGSYTKTESSQNGRTESKAKDETKTKIVMLSEERNIDLNGNQSLIVEDIIIEFNNVVIPMSIVNRITGKYQNGGRALTGLELYQRIKHSQSTGTLDKVGDNYVEYIEKYQYKADKLIERHVSSKKTTFCTAKK